MPNHATRGLLATENSAEEESSHHSHGDEPADTGVQGLSVTASYPQRQFFTRATTRAHDSYLDSIELSRIHTSRLQHAATIGSHQGAIPREQWLPLGAGKPYPPPLPDAEKYVVQFTGAHDSLHPHNWPLITKFVQ